MAKNLTLKQMQFCGISTRNLCGLFHLQFLLFFIIIFSSTSVVHSKSKKTDLRILIDVSGSMKENDPQNLRTPSVRLLIGLIPNGTKAGIWTFGKYVNMQVKHGFVNKSWKMLARAEAGKIHSRGLYTNIEAVLKKSSFDWKIKDPSTNRYIILLTDGVVDISKNPEINLKSRNKVIEYYLPRLKKAGVKIHTIALSVQADHELLKLLSVTTDGWYELIEDPKKLHRVFLRLFEKSTSVNSLPLENNTFKVDKSINDMTVLSFNSSKTDTKLITPDKKIITVKTTQKSINWFHEDGYDLITIAKPTPGDWSLEAPADKDNRVLVVTNLTLSVNDIPNNVLLNQKIKIKAELKQKNKKIINKKFLELVSVKATKKSTNEPEGVVKLYDNGEKLDSKANDGIYYQSIRSPLRAGAFELIVNAEGPTFQRQRQYLINVFSGLAEIDIKAGKEKEPFIIEIKPHKGLLKTGSIEINYELEKGQTGKINKNENSLWKLELSAEKAGEKIAFTIKGIRQNNSNVEMQMERMLPERIKKIVKPLKSDKNKTKKKSTKSKSNLKEADQGGWLSVLIWVLIINVILITIALAVFFVLKKIRAKKLVEDEKELKL